MGLGVFAGGFAGGLLGAEQYLANREKRKLLQERVAEARRKNELGAGIDAAMTDAIAGNTRQDSGRPAPSAPKIEEGFDVPGAGFVGDAGSADQLARNSAAEAELAAQEGATPPQSITPKKAYRVGTNIYADPADAIRAGNQAAEDAALAAGPAQKPRQNSGDEIGQFLRVVRPRVVANFIKQGNPTAAKAFMDFTASEEGKAYSRDWLTAMRSVESGDFEGAIPGLARLYNTAVPDGRRAAWRNLGDGQFQVDQYDEASGELVGSKTFAAPDLARLALGTLAPHEHVKFLLNRQNEQAKADRDLNKAIEVDTMRAEREAARDDRRDARQQAALESMDRRQTRNLEAIAERAGARAGTLTTPQQRTNAEIDAARERLSGMDQAEILRRSQPTTATGRENPEYDPQMARLYRLANSRKYGDDPDFDTRAKQQPKPQPTGNLAQRFSADPAMKGHKLGKATPKGIEVFDATGRLVGHYR